MRYISVGTVMAGSTEVILHVNHYGQEFALSSIDASLWLNGKVEPWEVNDPLELRQIRKLQRIGLVIQIDETEDGLYWALTKCMIVPIDNRPNSFIMNRMQRYILKWITEAGLRLTIAELIYLSEHRIVATEDLLGLQNRQALTTRIYNQIRIQEQVLEVEMSYAINRDEVVSAVLSLLKKKQIVLI